MDALLVSQASDGFAVLPGVNNKHAFGLGDSAAYGMDEQYNVGGGMTVYDAGCRCPGAGYESTVDPAAKSAADLMGAFDGGMGQLAEPKLSLEEAINRIDALTRSRIHLGKEKVRGQLLRQMWCRSVLLFLFLPKCADVGVSLFHSKILKGSATNSIDK